MSLRKGTPGKGDHSPRHEHFAYTPTPPGSKPWTAWCANEPYWCLGHPDHDSGTKPCLHWLTEGALQCPRCRPGHSPAWIGYLGVWREEDLTARLIVLREQNSELSEFLQFGDYIIISRAAGDGNPIAVRRSLNKKPWQSRKAQRQRAADFTPSLLTIWKLPMLSEWYAMQQHSNDNEVSLERRIYVRDDGSVYAPEYQAAARRAGAQSTTDPATVAAYDQLLEKLRRGEGTGGVGGEPGTNGHHKKKKE